MKTVTKAFRDTLNAIVMSPHTTSAFLHDDNDVSFYLTGFTNETKHFYVATIKGKTATIRRNTTDSDVPVQCTKTNVPANFTNVTEYIIDEFYAS